MQIVNNYTVFSRFSIKIEDQGIFSDASLTLNQVLTEIGNSAGKD